MKDDLQNRARLGASRKLRLTAIALRENGIVWCLMLATYYVTSSVADRAFRWMHQWRQRQGIPGLNSPTLNREVWNAWNWNAGGEEWSGPAEWMESLRRNVMDKWIPEGSSVLEIGPGAGRWTSALLDRARNYVGVDISETCTEQCRRRFSGQPHGRFLTGSGVDLLGVEHESVDSIWSFDVFVHINHREFEQYTEEFLRVLKPGGCGVIHHGSVAGSSGGWRSDVTASSVRDMLAKRGLVIEDAFGEWSDGNNIHRLSYDDQITVFRRSA